MHFGDKTNGQTFRKKAKFSFEKSSFEFKKRKDKHFKKKQMQFGEQRTDKHFQKQQNTFWRKNKRANISKKSKTQFREIELQKTNGQTLKNKCSLEKTEQTNISKNRQMQFQEKSNISNKSKMQFLEIELRKTNAQKFPNESKCSLKIRSGKVRPLRVLWKYFFLNHCVLWTTFRMQNFFCLFPNTE